MSGAELALLGLAKRAGALVVGSAAVREALRRGRVQLVVVAVDRSVRTDEKVVRLAHGRGVRVAVGPAATELGRQLGRETVQAVGVTHPQLARRIDAVSVPIRDRRK
ncbi:MAG: ribosomal L7Ae/L30e/S12e/Gadd45 family protein [Gemmatimonadota bacterium]|nr:MAG: ribosomal L7Ae/L30e/S12e/Gadd45 family protein [Gemmatimonadota bacterium]